MAGTIRAWLEALELGHLSALFEENEVGLRDLSLLTDDDLRDLGLALGPRRRILNAVARSVALDNLTPSVGTKAEPNPVHAAERRQLTVMFCDLVGSTELSQRLDPEDLRDLMRRYQDVVVGAVARYGGHVANFLGDGVLTYFGWPRAYEDQAERAVRAALDATTGVQVITHSDGETLSTRVGIATGQVVVGDIIGEAASELHAVTGQTPNLAARLQGAASPGQICIDSTTRQLIGASFNLNELGGQHLKGFGEPMPIWQVVGESNVESRFDAVHKASLKPLVGRDYQLDQLRECWNLANAGTNQIVFISGEAGIGKSRLAVGLSEHISNQKHIRLRYQCSAHHTDSALYPIVQHFRRAAKFESEDPPLVKLDKMERLLQQAEDDVSTSAPLFAAMLSLPVEERYGPIELSAEQRREKIITAMVGQVVALSHKQPVLVVMEDAHWIDPTTELFLTQLRQTIAGQAIMIVVTHRPHYSPPLLQSSEATKILLERLNQQQSEDVVHGIGGKLASSIVQRIVARADGIPLFLEELTKSVAEAKTTDPSSTVLDELPTSLQATLLARLDRLDLPREVLQIGAVIGRSFSHDLIAAVIGGPEDNLRQDLTNIVKSELISCRGDPPDAIYSFKHALIHDAAYDTLLRSKRRYYHGTIADILLKEFPDRAEAEPGVLARHLSEAQQPERAVEYWQKAGRRASERSENNEAITSFEHGLNDLQKIVGQPSRNQTELDIRLALGASLLAARGWSAETVRENYERAVELSAVADDDSKKINALRGLGNVYFLRGQINEARELIDQELKLISVHDDPSLEMGGFRAVGMCSFFIGDFVAARTNLAKANAIYDPAEHAAQKFSQGTDPAVIGLSMLGWTEWFLGHSEKAEANISAALDHAENLKHPFSLAYAQCIAASVYQCLRNAPRTLELSQAANATANENNYPYWSGWATMMQGWASANLGGVEQGIKQLRQGLEIYEATGARQIKPYALVLLADLYCQTGDLKAGLKSVSEAYGDGNPTDVSFFEAEALRVSGELRKLAGQPAAIDFLQRSDAIASKQNSLALRLRARISIYKAANGADELANAHQSLAEVYADVKQNLSAPEMEQAQLILATQNPRS